MKVRCSTGLRVVDYNGAFFNRTGQDTDLAMIDSDKAILVTLAHDGSGLKAGTECYLQAALLYTTPHRQRRVRVHTLCLNVTSEVSVVFKNADYEVVTNYMMRRGEGSACVHAMTTLRRSHHCVLARLQLWARCVSMT